MSQDDPTKEADIEGRGFCNPPVESRFHKGQSGNPAGRPKRSKNRRPALAERFRSLMLEDEVKVAVEGHLDPRTLTRRLNALVDKRTKRHRLLSEQAR